MTNRTALFSRVQPGGVFTIEDLREHPGAVFFVDSAASGASDSAGGGKSPDVPFATLDYAIGKCTADKGDVVYVMPGHSEILGAAGVTMDVAGVKVVGLGEGDNRPHFHFTGTASTFLVTGAGCVIENLRFLAGISAVVVGLNVTAESTIIRKCEWYWGGTTTWDFVIACQLNVASSRSIVEGCRFLAEPATAGADCAVKLTGASNNVVIKANEFMGEYATSAIRGITTLGQGLMILNNLAYITTGVIGVLLTGTTGIIAGTRGVAAGATIAANFVADAMVHADNVTANSTGTVALQAGRGAGGSPALDAD